MNPSDLPFPAGEVRRAGSRGHLQLSWLDARFSFSFGDYRDPLRERFGPLLALNEDRVQPGTGFSMHPHTDLEIFIVPRAGTVEHRDSLGNHMLLARGDVQMMRAGSGIRHSQMNPSSTAVDHHFQIWIEPRTRRLAPAVEQGRVDALAPGEWTLIVSPDGEAGSLTVDQDVRVFLGETDVAHPLRVAHPPGRSLYVHVMDGAVEGRIDADADADAPFSLEAGDALVMFETTALQLRSSGPVAGLLLFDVPQVASPGG